MLDDCQEKKKISMKMEKEQSEDNPRAVITQLQLSLTGNCTSFVCYNNALTLKYSLENYALATIVPKISSKAK